MSVKNDANGGEQISISHLLTRAWINTNLQWLNGLEPSCVQRLPWPWFQGKSLIGADVGSNAIRTHFYDIPPCW